MRMVNNESLEPRRVMDVLKEPMEMYIEAIESAARGDDGDEPDNYDPEGGAFWPFWNRWFGK